MTMGFGIIIISKKEPPELSFEKGTKKQVNTIKRQSNLGRSNQQNNLQMILKYGKE